MEASNPYAAPTSEVRDILPPGAQSLAGRGTRLGAAILDTVIILLFVYLPVLVFEGPDAFVILTEGSSMNFRFFLQGTGGMLGLVGLLALIGITIYLVHRSGQTLGKRMLGIKVVRKDGSRATLGRIFVARNLPFWVVNLIPLVGPILSLVDALLIFRASHQCVHDQLADTIVVNA